MKQKTEEDGWRGFLGSCSKIKNITELDEFFSLFLTLSERQEIAGRALIIRELLKGGKTQREIARDLGVSIANVSRGSNVLKTTGSRLKKFLEN